MTLLNTGDVSKEMGSMLIQQWFEDSFSILEKSEEDSKDKSCTNMPVCPRLGEDKQVESERKVPGQTLGASYDVAEGVSSSSSSPLPSEQSPATPARSEDHEDSMDAYSSHSECPSQAPTEPSDPDQGLDALMERLPMTKRGRILWGYVREHREEIKTIKTRHDHDV